MSAAVLSLRAGAGLSVAAALAPYLRCPCGRSYDRTAAELLPYVGFQHDGEGGGVHLCNCRCGSTCALLSEPGRRP